MVDRPSPPPKVCRRCGLDQSKTRFGELARTLCQACRPPRAVRVSHRSRIRSERRDGECPEHLNWIRTLPCLVACQGVLERRGGRCGTVIHAHHVRLGTGGGTGMKPADRWTVPLCPRHHLELHNHGALTFNRVHGLDLRGLAAQLADISPYLTELSCDALPF